MKKQIKYWILMLLAITILNSCGRDYLSTSTPPIVTDIHTTYSYYYGKGK